MEYLSDFGRWLLALLIDSAGPELAAIGLFAVLLFAWQVVSDWRRRRSR